MFWLCYQEWQDGLKRVSHTRVLKNACQSWIVEADCPPDNPNEYGELPYPFNGVGGRIVGCYDTEEETYSAEAVLWDTLWGEEA